MIEYIKKWIPKKDKDKAKESFRSDFFNGHNHEWINQDPALKRGFSLLIDSLTHEHIQFFYAHPTYFIPCQAQLSCAVGKTKNHHIILVFPELITLLKTSGIFHGISVLAHEMGHIYHQHTEKRIDPLTAQIEADRFAFLLGFGEELQEVLLDHAYSIDCRVRISRLTSEIISLRGK
jgi:hypothetical protein